MFTGKQTIDCCGRRSGPEMPGAPVTEGWFPRRPVRFKVPDARVPRGSVTAGCCQGAARSCARAQTYPFSA